MATMTHDSVRFQATRARHWFRLIQRDGDTDPPEAGLIWTYRDDLGILPKTRAQNLSGSVHFIDGRGILPDDWKYMFMIEALDTIEDFDGLDVDDMREQYTSEHLPDEPRNILLAWYDSHGLREAYIEDGVCNQFDRDIITTTLQWGINAERLEVFELVCDWVQQEADRA